MRTRALFKWFSIGAIFLAAAPGARAQWSVVDIPATVQIVKQVETAGQQLMTAKSQLQQAEQTLQSMSGDRGMQLLLSNLNRNYLPGDWASMMNLSQRLTGVYGSLATTVASLQAAIAVLSPEHLAALSNADQLEIVSVRQRVATKQAVFQNALSSASSRFASLQTLIAAIGAATDPKAILDLQARINAELGMVQNEQTKLQALAASFDAQDAAARAREREQGLEDQGRFATRFQPVP
jgi:type IV secretion system protein VirB5